MKKAFKIITVPNNKEGFCQQCMSAIHGNGVDVYLDKEFLIAVHAPAENCLAEFKDQFLKEILQKLSTWK